MGSRRGAIGLENLWSSSGAQRHYEERRAFEVEGRLGGRDGVGGGGQGGVYVARLARGVAGAPWQVPRCHCYTCSRLNLLLFAGKDKKFHKTLLMMMTAMGQAFRIYRQIRHQQEEFYNCPD